MNMFTPLVIDVIDAWSVVEEYRFKKHLTWLFPALLSLIRTCQRPSVHAKVADVLEAKLQPLIIEVVNQKN